MVHPINAYLKKKGVEKEFKAVLCTQVLLSLYRV